MKNGKRLLRKINGIDIALAVLLIIALVLSGYVHMEKTREMGDTAVLYVEEEDLEIKRSGFQTAESG